MPLPESGIAATRARPHTIPLLIPKASEIAMTHSGLARVPSGPIPIGRAPRGHAPAIHLAAWALPGGCVEVDDHEAWLRLAIPDPTTPGEVDGSYELRVEPGGVRLRGVGDAGIRHGMATLEQLLSQYARDIPTMVIRDAPAFATRGVMLDISRDRVPTMPQLFETVDAIAALKGNHLQLYTEHTFAYAGHEAVWAGFSPITSAEVRELDVYCRGRGIELAANQNCFGHLASWLRHGAYADLAETHGDWMFDVWPRSGPFSLCPTDPRSLAFVEGLLDQLLPCFASPLVNIGCDETYDIAYGRSRDEVARRGREAVYLEFVGKVAEAVRRRGKHPMFWADIALSHPECIPAIPRGLIALAWGYEPDAPFRAWCDALRDAGREAWVCPGTSSWRSITGRTAERRANLRAAAAGGAGAGATGFLACDWGDVGHSQQWPIALHGIADALSAAWGGDREAFDPAAESLHVFRDPRLETGDWLEAFGACDDGLRATCQELSRPVPGRLRNATALFADLHTDEARSLNVGDHAAWSLALANVEDRAGDVPGSAPTAVREELVHAARVARFAARRGCARRARGGVPTSVRRDLLAEIAAIEDEHRRLWLRRARPGGLEQSCSHYGRVAASLAAGGRGP